MYGGRLIGDSFHNLSLRNVPNLDLVRTAGDKQAVFRMKCQALMRALVGRSQNLMLRLVFQAPQAERRIEAARRQPFAVGTESDADGRLGRDNWKTRFQRKGMQFPASRDLPDFRCPVKAQRAQ